MAALPLAWKPAPDSLPHCWPNKLARPPETPQLEISSLSSRLLTYENTRWYLLILPKLCKHVFIISFFFLLETGSMSVTKSSRVIIRWRRIKKWITWTMRHCHGIPVGTSRWGLWDAPQTAWRHRDLGAEGRRESSHEVVWASGGTKETSDLLWACACGSDHQTHRTDAQVQSEAFWIQCVTLGMAQVQVVTWWGKIQFKVEGAQGKKSSTE